MVGIHLERSLTFSRIERKTPVLGPALQSKSELLVWPPPQWGTEGEEDQIISIKRAADGRRQRSREVIDEEKSTGPKTDPCGTPRRTRKERLCDFGKPHKRAYQKGKIEFNEQSKDGGQPKSVCGKGRCARHSLKAFEKSIVDRVVREPGLGLLNPFEMDWERYRI